MKTVYVFDTNVLLNDPYAIFAYDDAEIVIPQTVLAELDRLKTGRVDRETRFRGREFSRVLFELSEHGQLTEGIPLDNESTVKIVPFLSADEFPEQLNSKNADDRILGCAWRISRQEPESHVVLITNDLNMLLKAQTLGVEVKQHEFQDEAGPISKLITRWTHRRVTMLWLTIPVILVAIFIALWLFRIPSPISTDNRLTQPQADPLQTFAVQEAEMIKGLSEKPEDEQGWVQLARLQLDWAGRYQNAGLAAKAEIKYQDAVNSYRNVLKLNSRNLKAQYELGNIYSVLGNNDQAIVEYLRTISINPNFGDAHFDLALAFWRHQQLKDALAEFETYLNIAPDGVHAADANQAINQIKATLKS